MPHFYKHNFFAFFSVTKFLHFLLLVYTKSIEQRNICVQFLQSAKNSQKRKDFLFYSINY